MRTLLIAYYHQAIETAITAFIMIIILSIPSTNISDISYYKALFETYKNILPSVIKKYYCTSPLNGWTKLVNQFSHS